MSLFAPYKELPADGRVMLSCFYQASKLHLVCDRLLLQSQVLHM